MNYNDTHFLFRFGKHTVKFVRRKQQKINLAVLTAEIWMVNHIDLQLSTFIGFLQYTLY